MERDLVSFFVGFYVACSISRSPPSGSQKIASILVKIIYFSGMMSSNAKNAVYDKN